MVTLVLSLLLTSLKNLIVSVSEIHRCTNCVCNNLLFRSVLVPTNDFIFVSFFPKRNSIGILEKLQMPFFSLREASMPLENLRAHLHTTIGSAVFDMVFGETPNPHPLSFVAKERDGLPVLLFSIFKVSSLSSRGLQVGFADFDNALAYIVSILCMCSKELCD